MKAVMLDIEPGILDGRRRTGADHWDEIWDGPEVWIIDRDTRQPEVFRLSDADYHAVPPDRDGWVLSSITGTTASDPSGVLYEFNNTTKAVARVAVPAACVHFLFPSAIHARDRAMKTRRKRARLSPPPSSMRATPCTAFAVVRSIHPLSEFPGSRKSRRVNMLRTNRWLPWGNCALLPEFCVLMGDEQIEK